MIKAQELRLGNIVQRPEHLRIDMLDGGDIYFRVNSTMIRDCEHYKEDWAFEPIELTPELLGKIKGCERAKIIASTHENMYEGNRWEFVEGFELWPIYEHPAFDLRVTDKGYELIHIGAAYDESTVIHNTYRLVFKYLHELQNWAALTGTELEITL